MSELVPGRLLSPAGALDDSGRVDPMLTLMAAETVGDPAVRAAIAAGFCAAVERSAACGAVAPAAFTPAGDPAGSVHDAGTAAVALLLGHDLLSWPPIDTTPAHRGTSDDERRFLADVRSYHPVSEVAPKVTAAELLAAHGRPAPPSSVVYAAGVTYVQRGDEPQRLHLHRPADISGPGAPIVVFIHGGGWENGNPAKYLRPAAEWALRGWVTACIGYRLVPAAQFPAPYDDVLAALAWVRDAASEIGADPDRVVLVGDSAGGHLALLAGSTPPPGVTVRGVVTLSPLTDPESTAIPAEAGRMLGRFLGDDPHTWAAASPLRVVGPSSPPVLSFVGSLDTLTTPTLVRRYHDALDAEGVPNRLIELPGRYHAFEFAPADQELWTEAAVEWIADVVGSRR